MGGGFGPLPQGSRMDLDIDSWETPASAYPEERVGDYRIVKQVRAPGRYLYHHDGYGVYRATQPLSITHLQELRDGHWQTWMVDSPRDYRSMQKYAERASGRVLTSGLGLGLLVHELWKNPAVETVTVVENNPAVMALTGKHLPRHPRLELEWGDFWQFIVCDDREWDWVIVDIWVYTGFERYSELLQQEVLPMEAHLQARYPAAKLAFHGFREDSFFRGDVDSTMKQIRLDSERRKTEKEAARAL